MSKSILCLNRQRLRARTNPQFTMSQTSPAHATAHRRNLFSPGEPNVGGADRDRTDDLKLAKLPLSQLSYGPDPVRAVVGPDRFELSTPRLSSVCSNQLSYGPSPAAVRAFDTHSATGLANSHASRGSQRLRVLRRRETKTATNRKYPSRP